MKDLAKETILGFILLILALGVLLFAVAWTITFWQAWVYLFVFAASAGLITLYLWKHDPKLLERRVKAGPGAEKEKRQILIQAIASLAFIGIFVVSSLDHRFSWSTASPYSVIAGDFLVVLGFAVIFIVFKENTYTAGTIEVAKGQKVISTGPYSVIRHPMYVGGILLLLGTPLALGSLWALIMFVAITAAIVWRLLDEEEFLFKKLRGYKEYCRKVRYRLVPYVW